MENIYEKSVVGKKTAVDNIITLAAVLVTLGGIALSILWEPLRLYAIAIAIVLVIAAWRVITDRNVEYEYTLAGDSFALDKILNKRRRKRILNCDLTDFDIVAPVNSRHYEEYRNNYAKKIVTVSGDMPEEEFFGILEYKGRRTLVVFETDERARMHIARYLDYKFKH
ncbi:MAG TPA: DUF6106 family protein [Clostridia bacterium]|nr:DUF6106 family protein [Clostridia bacterium]HPQ46278.1 DUF6106 family protein [Clostridia bacterium]HRX41262.1 DUF6106 family protein [Clostridia bacterium]